MGVSLPAGASDSAGASLLVWVEDGSGGRPDLNGKQNCSAESSSVSSPSSISRKNLCISAELFIKGELQCTILKRQRRR